MIKFPKIRYRTLGLGSIWLFFFGLSAAAESWYPRTVTSNKGTIIIYAPQIDTWKNFATLNAWVAFRITAAGSEDTYYGSVNFDASTDTDVQAREVLLHDVVIHELTIEGLDEDSLEHTLVREVLTTKSRTVPLDLILEYLPEEMNILSTTGLNPDPPKIFASTTPALLLSVDAEPVFVPVGAGELQFVINTNWDVLRVADAGALYFCHRNAWLSAADFTAPWDWAHSLPKQFSAIPDNANWSNVQDCLPSDLSTLIVPEQIAPTVFYSAEPAELLQLTGDPEWEMIGESELAYATNTQQELFRVGDAVYFLISGRWFQARDINGPWTMAVTLPDAFQKIPPDNGDRSHPKSYVRTSVPGTQEAWEAALVASIPRKAEIVRGTESALSLNVIYAGEPIFTTIESTEIEMAVNTSFQVLRYNGAYYLCHNAVWLTGFGPNGPWLFADSVPAAFATIPPSSPAYNTTFVTIEGSNEKGINYAYTSGYEGAYVSDSTVVYGTGYPSPAITFTVVYGVYGGGYGYPYYPYYPWPRTYGYGSWYDPGSGRYGEAVVGYGPYGAAGSAAVYNPTTGAYARGQAVWDNDEFAGRSFGYNPTTGTSMARNRYVDFDDKEGWSQSVARRGDEWRYSQSEWEDGSLSTNIQRSDGGTGQLNRQSGNGEITGSSTFTKDGQTIETNMRRTEEGVQRQFETSGGGQGVSMRSGNDSAFAYQSGSGDVYAGRDGNVYQKTDDGWTPVENPGAASDARSARTDSTSKTSRVGMQDTQMRTDVGNRNYEALPAGGFAGARNSGGNYQDGGGRNTFSSGGSSLDRDYRSRQNGFNRYSQHRSQSSFSSRSRRGSYGRRRR